MPTLNYSFCSFSDNLIPKILSERSRDDTVFVFPTENSRQAAIREFQREWRPSNTLLITMEEFKTALFFSAQPILKEERRTLAFYACMTRAEKKAFRINNYFQSIELAHHFFDLWEEFNEELVDENIDREMFTAIDAEILDWQWETYQRLLALKQRYEEHIHARGFEDIIFLYKPDQIDVQQFAEYQNIVFVNQFYYTKLEKEIIRKLYNAQKHIHIYYQLPEKFVDKERLDIKPFKLDDFQSYRTRRIHIMEAPTGFSQLIALFKYLDDFKIQALVDNGLLQNVYDQLLAFDQFKISPYQRFEHSSIYRFFATLQKLLSELIFEPNGQKFLLPLQVVIDAFQEKDFINYLKAESNLADESAPREQSLDFLYYLAENDYKYLDLDLEILRLERAKNEHLFRLLVRLIERFLSIKSIGDLVDRIDSEDGVVIEKICSDFERWYSNIFEVFYQALSDFSSIESIGLVEQWDDYFPDDSGPGRRARISSGLLRLFLDYLRPKSVKLDFQENQQKQISMSTLQDTRNIQFQNVAILNVVEGELPHKRQIPFLFSEQQRKLLGLKSFEDVRVREKYYFLRLILNATEVFIFTQQNIEENIETSSFVEEIKLFFPAEKLIETRVEENFYRSVYRNFLSPAKDYLPDQNVWKSPEFFRIPLEQSVDFPDEELDLTNYKYKNLQENRFTYYIRYHGDIDEKKVYPDKGISSKLLGNIAHDVMTETWRLLEDRFGDPIFGYDFDKIDRDVVQQAMNVILKSKEKYFLKLPRDHSFIYFRQIMIPAIMQGIVAFFHFLHDLGLSGKRINAIPEREYIAGEERHYKMLLPPEDNALEISVRLRGKADLRIEDVEEDRYFIFDYKTGGYGVEQLIFYELFYYLIEKPQMAEHVSSYFFQLLDKSWSELRDLYRIKGKRVKDKQLIFTQFKEDVRQILTDIAGHGFALPEKRTLLADWPEITRKDLFLRAKRYFDQVNEN